MSTPFVMLLALVVTTVFARPFIQGWGYERRHHIDPYFARTNDRNLAAWPVAEGNSLNQYEDLEYDALRKSVSLLSNGDISFEAIKSFIARYLPEIRLPEQIDDSLFKEIRKALKDSGNLPETIRALRRIFAERGYLVSRVGYQTQTNDLAYDLVKKWVQFLDDVGDVVAPVSAFVSKFIPKLTLPPAVNKTLYKAIYKIIMFSDELDQAISDITKLVTGRNGEALNIYLEHSNLITNDIGYELAKKWVDFLDDVGDVVEPVTRFVSKFIPGLTLPSSVNKTLYKAIYKIIKFSDDLDGAIRDITKLVTGRNAGLVRRNDSSEESLRETAFSLATFDPDSFLKFIQSRTSKKLNLTTTEVQYQAQDGCATYLIYTPDLVVVALYHPKFTHAVALASPFEDIEDDSLLWVEKGRWAVGYIQASDPHYYQTQYRVSSQHKPNH